MEPLPFCYYRAHVSINADNAQKNEVTIAGRSVWKIGDEIVGFDSGPKVMAIVNVTPDSFSDGGQHMLVDKALRFVDKAIEDGAEFIDVGGESTRPGGKPVDPDIEIERVVPVIKAIAERFDTRVSVDTWKSRVAEEAIDAGAVIINDISGLNFDKRMASVAALSKAGLILMHLEGDFESMHETRDVADIVADVESSLTGRVADAVANGIEGERICVDVGIGFGKTFEQNLLLIKELGRIVSTLNPVPMLVGLSRKRFIGQITGHDLAADRVAGSVAANCMAVLAGAAIVRVHDVRAAVDAIQVVNAIKGVR